MFKKFLIDWGRRNIEREESKADYVPQYGGTWINQGTWDKEDWVWQEDSPTSITPIYVHVYLTDEQTKEITIRITHEQDSNALSTINSCENEQDIQNVLELLAVGYRDYKVTIVRENLI